MKGISPLIASVLLIAITMTLAAILASFVSSYTQQQLAGLPTCVGGTITFSTADYPRWDGDAVKTITAVIEVGGVDLNSFSFEILKTDDTIQIETDTLGASISAGGSDTIKSGNTGLNLSDISKVRVVAGNCPGVKTSWTTLKT